MTSVLGHLTSNDFPTQYKTWQISTCRELFDAPVITRVAEVGRSTCDSQTYLLIRMLRIKNRLREISLSKLDIPRLFSSGLIAIEKESILAPKYGKLPLKARLESKLSERYSATRKERKGYLNNASGETLC